MFQNSVLTSAVQMDQFGDVVNDLQHSLMNAHGLLKKMKAITRQLNASHTLLLMKQSTSNEQLTEYVQEIRLRLELFHDNMAHQLKKSFQQKTLYLDTCLRQLQFEEKTIDQLCSETEVLLKQVTRSINPMQYQKARTLLQAFKMLTKDNSASLELEEDVICLDFVPCKPVEDISSFGSIRVSRDCPRPNQISVEQSNSKTTASRGCQTEILFRDYCPFCGRTYSKGKKDAEVQSNFTCSECRSQPTRDENKNEFVSNGHLNDGKYDLKSEQLSKDLTKDQEYKGIKNRKRTPSIKEKARTVIVNYESSDLEETEGKRCSSNEQEKEITPVPVRKRSALTGKKLKDLNKQSMEDIWHSSEDEMEEVTAWLSNQLTFAAAVKHKGDGKQQSTSNESQPKSEQYMLPKAPIMDELTELHTNYSAGDSVSYIPPPPVAVSQTGSTEMKSYILPQEKLVPKPKKRTLAAKSLNMLTGLINTAKAENVINPPYTSRRQDKDEDCDWWGSSDSPKVRSEVHVVSPQKQKSEVYEISPQKLKSEVHVVSSQKLKSEVNMFPTSSQPKIRSVVYKVSPAKKSPHKMASDGSSEGVPECWMDEVDSSAPNSLTSTPKSTTKSATNTDLAKFPQLEEFRLRRPSFSLKVNSSIKEKINTGLDANNNNNSEGTSLEESFKRLNISQNAESKNMIETIKKEPFDSEIKKEPFSPGQDSTNGVGDSGWEEDSTVWDSKGNGKELKGYQGVKNTYTDSWTKNVTAGVTAAMQGAKSFLLKTEKAQNAGYENWEEDRKGESNSNEIKTKPRKPSRWDQLPPSSPTNKPPEMEVKYRISRWDIPPPNSTQTSEKRDLPPPGVRTIMSPLCTQTKNGDLTQSVIPSTAVRNTSLSPVAKYIGKQSKGDSRDILPPIPAQLIGKIGGKDKGMHFPIGVATTNEGDIVVADTGNHLIKIFTFDGELKGTVGSQIKPPMQRPSAIVINNRDDLFVKDDKCIRMIDLVQGVMLRHMGAKVLSMPYGLSFTPEENLLTLDVDKKDPKIVIFSQKGELLNTFPFCPLLGRVPQTRCRFLGVNNNNLVVSDLGRHEVYVTDLQGKLKFTFGRGGYANGEFYEPSGVEVDSSGNMIIADSKNDRVQIFRPDGSFACNVGFSEPIKRPSDIHLTKDGKLIVVNFLYHQLKIYKLKS